jgi:glycosyltransferase involved in cell wall biosynthesis
LLDKSTLIGYALHQIRLAWKLAALLRAFRGNRVAIYARFNVTSVVTAPLVWLSGARYVLRTGPVLPSLEAYGKRGRAVRIIARLTLALNLRAASAVIVVTERIREYLALEFPYCARKLAVVPNGIDVDGLDAIVKGGVAAEQVPTEFTLCFVGYLYEDQGVQTVLRALGKLKDRGQPLPRFVVVGDGVYRESLTLLATELGVDNVVHFTGALSHHDAIRCAMQADVMLAPFTTRVFEVTGASSLKVFEYLALDKPLLVSKGFDHEFVSVHRFGETVPAEDVDAWASAISRCMQNRKGALEGRGKAFVRQFHSMRRVGDDVMALCFPQGDK